MLNDTRVGRFTSSEIYLLMKKGRGDSLSVATQTYIDDKKLERRLGRSLNSDTSSRSTSWGSFIEPRVADMLDPFEYAYQSQETIIHKTIDTWAGTPDVTTFDMVGDIKCPYTMKAFCTLADISIAEDVQRFKEEKPEYYWQLVSNAIITGRKKVELITYCPYKSELESIRESASNYDMDQNKIAWIYFSEDKDLPYVPDGGYYKNRYSLQFDVNQDDIAALEKAVIEASKQLEDV